MNTHSNAMSESPVESQAAASVDISPAQRFYWSVRRELWEHRYIYIAPLAAAGLFLVGFLIGTIHLPGKMRAALTLDPMRQHDAIQQPFEFAELLLMGTFIIVAGIYCLDALYGERRDRSILFWKSLPVSDLTTVLAKASIPVVILPLFTFAITVVTQGVMVLLSTAVLVGSGLSAGTFWKHFSLFQMWLGLFDHLVGFHGLWYAPFYCWLLLVSAWARRAPFLWATLPPLAIGFVEKIAFNTSYFGAMLQYRFSGGPEDATFMASSMSIDPPSHLYPVPFLIRLLISPGLWIGFVVAAAFLAGAVRLRRYRDPI
jgi:ABC-2 type transport system permease protein